MTKRTFRARVQLLAGVASLALCATGAQAAETRFDIPPQKLSDALRAFGLQSGEAIAFKGSMTGHSQSAGAVGRFEPDEALAKILRDTALTYVRSGNGFVVVPAQARLTPVVLQRGPAPAPAAREASVEPIRSPVLEEVVITSRKVPERLLDAPVTANAFTAEAISARNITTLSDVANYTPAVTLTNQGGARVDRSSQTIIIRGMNPQSSQTASVFIDGASVTGGFVEGLDDVERVEILKGPQTTAFGRQAFAGAINIVTKDPAREFGGRVELLGGSDKTIDARLMLEGPVIRDKLFVRVAGRYFDQDGQYDNNAMPGERLGDKSTKSVNAAVLFTPVEGLRIKYFGQVFRNEDGPSAVAHFGPSDFNCNAGAAPAGRLNYICGEAPGFPRSRLAMNVAVDPLFVDVIMNNSKGLANPLFIGGLGLRHGGLLTKAYHHHLSGEYDIPGLGIKVSALTSIDRNESSVITDLDMQDTRNLPNPNFGVLPNTQPFINSLFNFQSLLQGRSSEIRMQPVSPGRFRWLLGANYVYSQIQSTSNALLAAGVSNQINGNPTRTETYGVFGSVAYDVLSNLNVSLEARYQEDTVGLYNRGPLNGPITLNLEATFVNFLPRVIVKYNITPDWHVYGSYSKGANPGAFNSQFPNLPAVQRAFLETAYGATLKVRPEQLDSYELGTKGRFLDGRLQLQLSLYHAIWSDQIVSQSLSVQQLNAAGQPTGLNTVIGASTNIGETILEGAEVEGAFKATDALTVGFSGAVASSDIQNFFCGTCGSHTGNPTVTGKQLPRYSKYSGTLSADYRQPFAPIADAEWFARGDYIYKSGVYDSPANLVRTPDSHIVNLRAGISTAKYKIEGFVLNAFNDKGYLSIENQVEVLNPTLRALNLQMPNLRQFGVRAAYSF